MYSAAPHAIFRSVMRFYSLFSATALLLAASMVSQPAALAATPVPTAEQMRLYQQLSPAQREALMRNLQSGGGLGQAGTVPTQPTSPGSTLPRATATPQPGLLPLEPEIRRIKGGDSLLLRFGRSTSRLFAQDDKETDKEREKEQERDKDKDKDKDKSKDRAARETIAVLDTSGVLTLPDIGRIPLAGLNEEEAAARLSVEPALKGIRISVKILPLLAELKPFGYDFFLPAPDSMAAMTEMPVPADYVIGPGDHIIVQLYGKDNLQYELPVTREGTILFPGIGPVQVAGLSYERLQETLAGRIQRQFIGMKSSVTVGRTRFIEIFVLGDVERPGAYTVSGHSTLTNALFASGGVKRIGSLRDVQLKRAGKLVKQMDFYDLLLNGDNRTDARLQPGDVIFVPPVGKTVGVGGEVRRPAIYELKGETTAGQAVALAGGLSPNAYPQKVQIERYQSGRDRVYLDIDLSVDTGRQTPLENGDIVRIYSVLDKAEQVVFLSGHVHRSGAMQWTEGMKIAQLLPDLGALPPNVDAHYLLIKRENPKDRTIELLHADLAVALETPDGDANIALQARDTVYVFSIHEDRTRVVEPLLDLAKTQSRFNRPAKEISIRGNVHQPGRYPLTEGMRVSDLLHAGGGLIDSTYLLEAELTRYTTVEGRDRKQENIRVDLASVLNEDITKDLALTPYDQLVIRRIPNWRPTESIKIAGEVRFTGDYPIIRGEKLSDVLKRAGGLSEKGFAPGAIFIRENVKQREQQQIERLTAQLEQELAGVSVQGPGIGTQSELALAEGKSLLRQLRSTQAVGRVAINLERLMDGDEEYDITLQDGDKLFVPIKPDEVTVVGEVYYPTSHLFNRRHDTDDYVRMSGGVSERGNAGAIYVVHADGSVSPPASGWFARATGMGPGDTIVVPLKVDRVSSLKLATDISQIFYQFAVSAAALKALNVF